MPLVTMKELLEAGVHYGHHTSRWNPKMKSYIFCSRHSIHVVDLRQTVRGIVRARRFLTSIAEQGGNVLIVGTKRQARITVQEQAARAGIPFVAERWLGGSLTNFDMVMSRLRRLNELEAMEASGEIERRGKKYASVLRREMFKLQRNLSGIRHMRRVPDAIIIIDPRREKNALHEAQALGIPTICLVDTDSDPDGIDIVIPANEDAMRSIQLVCSKLMDAIIDGRSQMASDMAESDSEIKAPRPAPVVEPPTVNVHTAPPKPQDETPQSV